MKVILRLTDSDVLSSQAEVQLSPNELPKWQTKWHGWHELKWHLFGLLCCSCQWHSISPSICNSPDRTAETPRNRQQEHDSKFQDWGSFYFLTFYFCYGDPPNPLPPTQKKEMQRLQIHFWFIFCRKISFFNMQIKCIHQRIWKQICQGIPEWHSKKYTFYKRHRKTHKMHVWFRVCILLILLSHSTWVTIRNM